VLKNVSATPGVSRRLEARKNVGINPACPRRLKPHTNNADPCEIIAKVARKVAGIRVTGALAYDLACLVLGEIDARISTSAKLVDVAAGACLIRRNKGVVTDLLGNEWKPGSCTLVAARTKRLHDQLMDLLILG
jgi:fructose-1,6-bisphosphatase/inositol monophosphatase family enzyme